MVVLRFVALYAATIISLWPPLLELLNVDWLILPGILLLTGPIDPVDAISWSTDVLVLPCHELSFISVTQFHFFLLHFFLHSFSSFIPLFFFSFLFSSFPRFFIPSFPHFFLHSLTSFFTPRTFHLLSSLHPQLYHVFISMYKLPRSLLHSRNLASTRSLSECGSVQLKVGDHRASVARRNTSLLDLRWRCVFRHGREL